MSYSANQYNYATPLSSASNLVQDVITGAQLLDFSAWIANVASVGVSRGTYTTDLNQSTISITATQGDAFTPYEGSVALRIPAKPNTNYTLTCSRSGAEGRVFLFGNGLTTNMVESAAGAADIKITLLTGVDVTFITFRVGVQTAGQTATFSRIMICEGAEAKPWERYNNGEAYPVDRKYFALFDNKLDGSYFPIVGDVGLWGSALSDSTGALATPYVLTIEESMTVRSFRIIGSQYCYPVGFTAVLYNGTTNIATIAETANSSTEYYRYFDKVLSVTKVIITVTRISASNAPVRFYNVFNPDIMKRSDTLSLKLSGTAVPYETLYKFSNDSLKLKAAEVAPLAVKGTTSDTLKVLSVDTPVLTNIHSVMKSPSRQVYGKVYITYTDPMLDADTVITSNYTAYNSNIEQLTDAIKISDGNLFTMYENNLTGTYVLSDIDTQVGWVSGVLSGTGGVFQTPPYMRVSFAARPIVNLPVTFDDSHGNIPRDFTVTISKTSGTSEVKSFTNNTAKEVTIVDSTIADVVAIQITITKSARAGYPVGILELPLVSTFLYAGYQDDSRLISISTLEELTYEDDIEALGGISANETTIVLDNSTKEFYFNNPDSPVASQLKRNRKIEPYLGAEIVPGEIEWYKLGTYWSYKWDVPVKSLTATVVGFDTIGLLDTTSYIHHTVQQDVSIGDLIEYVLEDAKKSLEFLQYEIDESLYDVIIPYAWFDVKSHTAALRKISGCYPMHIYCDREGRIIAAPQRLHRDFFYDTWSDSTNVIDKSYSSLYTTLPNVINVSVKNISIELASLAKDETVFDTGVTRILNFNKPYLSDISVDVSCDDSVIYTYEAYSWGIEITFGGSGTIYYIECTGTALNTGDTSVVTQRDETSIHLNGAVTRDISSDFIQTSEHANVLMGRLLALSEYDKYDATVDYRGDISLSINDPIILHDGIAPTDKYNIKRHELYWNGALSGSADLNT